MTKESLAFKTKLPVGDNSDLIILQEPEYHGGSKTAAQHVTR